MIRTIAGLRYIRHIRHIRFEKRLRAVVSASLVHATLLATAPLFAATVVIDDVNVREDAGSVNIAIGLSAPSSETTRVGIATSKDTATNGSDFYGTYRILDFNPGETSKTLPVTILNDTEIEGSEQFKIRAFRPTDGGNLTVASVTIADDDSNLPPDRIVPINDVSLPGLPSVNDTVWNESAVRRVLHNFAYGGYPRSFQIKAWAEKKPWVAIKEILTAHEHNTRVAARAPRDKDNLTAQRGTLWNLGNLWSSSSASNRTPPNFRELFGNDEWQLDRLWTKTTLMRGLNPVRQKIGLWETNYHMAVNSHAGVSGPQMVRYYDDIMNAHGGNKPYHRIIGLAAASAAVAEQYKHKENLWKNSECECNEDFAREFHQLYFGILGTANPDFHETVTIKNTARVLTHMDVPWIESLTTYDPVLRFGSRYHHQSAIPVLGQQIAASSTAKPKIDQLADIAINHPESLANLPVKIVQGLADDNLPDWKINTIRQAWTAMPEKNLLAFLQAYAISPLYHDANRVKYWTSIDRYMILTSRISLSNEETHLEIYDPVWDGLLVETTPVFSPKHNVFGGQTGYEAARSSNTFMTNYNRVTEGYWRFFQIEGNQEGRNWRKDWREILPMSADGTYRVRDIAPWLWNYTVADGLKNFGDLERASVYAALAGPESLQWLLDENNLERVITSNDVRNDPLIKALVKQLGNHAIPFNSTDSVYRDDAQYRIGSAINFIAATPYMFAQEGR